MGARTGHEILARLKERPPTLWVEGELVTDPTTHPRTANVAQSLAALYDLQHRPDLVDVMTYVEPSTGERVGLSFIVPTTKDDLARRSAMNKVWADATLGFMGRTPDYLNVNVMAAGMAGDYFSQCDPRFGPNALAYFHHVRDHDLALTHALTNPQVDRSKSASELDDPFIALGLVRETADGIIVRGARMLATLPISDEILIFPSTVLKGGDDMKPYALAFAIPNDTPGTLVPVPRTARHRAQPRRPSARIAVRRDGRDGVLRRRARAVGARVPDERRRARQPGVRQDRRRAPHGAPGRQPQDLQDRGVPRRHAVGRRHDRHRRVSARAGDGRRGRDRARDHEGPQGGLRSRRHDQRLRRDDARPRPARRRPQLLPRRVPPDGRDPATDLVERDDHDPHRGRPLGSSRRPTSASTSVRPAARPTTGCACSAWRGT